MYSMPKRGTCLALLLALAAPCEISRAAAEEGRGKTDAEKTEIDSEHIFGFSEGSDIGEKGEREIEGVTIGSFGKIGSYNNVDNETSFRYGVLDSLRLSIGTLSDYYNIHQVPTLADRSSVNFSGIITEIRWNIVDRSKNAFGMSLSINPEWRHLDPVSGANSQNVAVPFTLLVDKEVIPAKLLTALNLIYQPSFACVQAGCTRADTFTVIAAATYAIAPNVFLGGEIRHENQAINGNLDTHALYLGPSLFYRFSKDFAVKGAWAAQIPDVGARTLDLKTYTSHQFEFQFAYTF